MKQLLLLSALAAGIWYYRSPETAPASQTVVSQAFAEHRKLTSRLWLETARDLRDGKFRDARAAQEHITAQTEPARHKAFSGVNALYEALPKPHSNEDFASLLERLAYEGDPALKGTK